MLNIHAILLFKYTIKHKDMKNVELFHDKRLKRERNVTLGRNWVTIVLCVLLSDRVLSITELLALYAEKTEWSLSVTKPISSASNMEWGLQIFLFQLSGETFYVNECKSDSFL